MNYKMPDSLKRSAEMLIAYELKRDLRSHKMMTEMFSGLKNDNKGGAGMKVVEMFTNIKSETKRFHSIDSAEELTCMLGADEWEEKNLEPNTRYACCMIPIPDGYRLATEEDRKGHKPHGTKILDEDIWADADLYMSWSDRFIYIVPLKTEKDAKVAELQAKLAAAREEVKAVEQELGSLS